MQRFRLAVLLVCLVAGSVLMRAATPAPAVVSYSPSAGAVGVTSTAIAASFNESIDPATVTASTFEVRTTSGAGISATITYDDLTHTAMLQPDSALTSAATYTAFVHGGTAGVKNLDGDAMTADVTWSFTTAGAPSMGVSARGRYGDESNDFATTSAVTTRETTNLVV